MGEPKDLAKEIDQLDEARWQDVKAGGAIQIKEPSTKEKPWPGWDVVVVVEAMTVVPATDLMLVLRQLERWKAWARALKRAGRWR